MDEPRNSPLLSQIVLWVLFAVLTVTSIFTVLIPELSDQSDDEEESSEAPPRSAAAAPAG